MSLSWPEKVQEGKRRKRTVFPDCAAGILEVETHFKEVDVLEEDDDKCLLISLISLTEPRIEQDMTIGNNPQQKNDTLTEVDVCSHEL